MQKGFRLVDGENKEENW